MQVSDIAIHFLTIWCIKQAFWGDVSHPSMACNNYVPMEQ